MPSIPQAHRGNPLIDAETTLVGVIAHGALRPAPKRFVSGEVVRLTTKLDAAARFTLVASHSSHTAAVTVDLQLAPLLIDGATGTFVSAVKVSLPAEGGRVEAYLSGRDISIAAADQTRVQWPCICFAKAVVTPSTPVDLHVGLTATIPA